MALEVFPVHINSKKLSITSLGSWGSSLLVGTTNEGILMLKIEESDTAFTAKIQSVFLPETPIRQLCVANFQNLLLVLSKARLSVYELNNFGVPSIRSISRFPQTNIEKFALSSESLHLCIAVPGMLYIYHHNGADFCEAYQISILQVPLAMVLTPTRLYFTCKMLSNTTGLIGSTVVYTICCCYNFSQEGQPEQVSIFRHPSIELISIYGGGSILIQHAYTSVIFDGDVQKTKFEWNTSPKAVVGQENCCIGITDDVVEVAYTNSTIRLMRKVQLEDSDPLRYITGNPDIYVASAIRIWRVILPANQGPSLDNPQCAMPTLPRVPGQPHKSKNPFLAPLKKIREDDDPCKKLRRPDNFSPLDSLAVVGLYNEDVNFFRARGITTVRKFAALSQDIVESYYREYLPYYRKAIEFMSHYQAKAKKDRVPEKGDIRDNVNPEDPLEALGLTKPQIDFLGSMMVFTVRQLALMERGNVCEFEGLREKRYMAVEALRRYNTKRMLNEESSEVYGYVYLTTREFSNCLDARALKSPYTLFQEYMSCEPNIRADHPWKMVYDHFYDTVKREMGYGDDNYSPSDADVFAYISVQYITTIGKTDATAMSRAIVFRLNGRRAQDDMHVVKINLTALYKEGGKVYTRTSTHEWREVTLKEYTQLQLDELIVKYGCIVMSSGTIEWENIDANIEQ